MDDWLPRMTAATGADTIKHTLIHSINTPPHIPFRTPSHIFSHSLFDDPSNNTSHTLTRPFSPHITPISHPISPTPHSLLSPPLGGVLLPCVDERAWRPSVPRCANCLIGYATRHHPHLHPPLTTTLDHYPPDNTPPTSPHLDTPPLPLSTDCLNTPLPSSHRIRL